MLASAIGLLLWIVRWACSVKVMFLQHWYIKSFRSHKAYGHHWSSFSQPSSQTPVYVARPRIRGYEASASRGVPVFVPAFAGTHCTYTWRDGQAELTCSSGTVFSSFFCLYRMVLMMYGPGSVLMKKNCYIRYQDVKTILNSYLAFTTCAKCLSNWQHWVTRPRSKRLVKIHSASTLKKHFQT